MNDNNTNILKLKDVVKEFCEERDWDQFHNPKDLAIGMSIEASELLEFFRFKNEDEIKEIFSSDKRQKIEGEIADIFYGLLRFAQMNDIDLSSALLNKLKKNSEKYPVSKAKGSNKKYTEL